MECRILLIDDDPGTLTTYRTILRLAGYDVHTASTGHDGLALLKAGAFGLVLTDLRLGDMSGLEVLAEASTTRPDVPVVMISAWGTEASEIASKRLGAAAFFHKSFEPDDLVETVRNNVSDPSDNQRRTSQLARESFVNHAATRWASLIVPVTMLRGDPKTIPEWGERIGKATATLKAWCAAAGVPPGDSLDFARLLRVVRLCAGRRCDWHNVLAIVDARTLAGLLERGGLNKSGSVPGFDEFLSNQRLIAIPALLTALRTLLDVMDRAD